MANKIAPSTIATRRRLIHEMWMGRRVSVFARSTRAAAAVEFAILVPVIAALLTGIANYGLAMFDKIELIGAARADVQYALLDASDTTAIANSVVDAANLSITTSDVTTTEFCEDDAGDSATCGDADATRAYMTVSVSDDFTLLILGTTITLTGTATVRTE
jgi:Flp pilus assembly protein TadG